MSSWPGQSCQPCRLFPGKESLLTPHCPPSQHLDPEIGLQNIFKVGFEPGKALPPSSSPGRWSACHNVVHLPIRDNNEWVAGVVLTMAKSCFKKPGTWLLRMTWIKTVYAPWGNLCNKTDPSPLALTMQSPSTAITWYRWSLFYESADGGPLVVFMSRITMTFILPYFKFIDGDIMVLY